MTVPTELRGQKLLINGLCYFNFPIALSMFSLETLPEVNPQEMFIPGEESSPCTALAISPAA